MKTKLSAFLFILFCANLCLILGQESKNSDESRPWQWYHDIKSYRIAHSSSANNLKLVREAASFEFKSGRIDIIQPVRGRYHAAVFEGEGLFTINPPTRIEKAQLKKFTGEENLVENADTLGKYFREEMQKVVDDLDIIKLVRGKGLLNAILIKTTSTGKTAWDVCVELKNNGLLAKPTHRDIIRFAPPLVITKEEIEWAVSTIKNVLIKFEKESSPAEEITR